MTEMTNDSNIGTSAGSIPPPRNREWILLFSIFQVKESILVHGSILFFVKNRFFAYQS